MTQKEIVQLIKALKVVSGDTEESFTENSLNAIVTMLEAKLDNPSTENHERN